MTAMIECGYPNDPTGAANIAIHDITVQSCPATYDAVIGMEANTADGRGSGKIHNVTMIENLAATGVEVTGDWHITNNRITAATATGTGLMTNIAAVTSSTFIDGNVFFDCDVGMELDNKSGGVIGIGTNAFENCDDAILALDLAGDYYNAHTVEWFFEGTLATGLHPKRWWPAGAAVLLYSQISVVTSPTGADLTVEMKINGTSNHSQPMRILDGAAAPAQDLDNINNINGNTMQVVTGNNDYVEMEILQVGSTIAGADLYITLSYIPLSVSA
jgi:hypothetical protein